VCRLMYFQSGFATRQKQRDTQKIPISSSIKKSSSPSFPSAHTFLVYKATLLFALLH